MRQGKAPAVPVKAKQGAEARDWTWVEGSVWTDRMVSALVNGVKGGRLPSSHKQGCSRFTQPGLMRDAPDEETTNWRAVCGKTARTVRRAGRLKPSRLLSINICRMLQST